MRIKIRVALASLGAMALVLGTVAADAQQQADPGTIAVGLVCSNTIAVGWVCSNQSLVAWLITALCAHTAFSGLSAVLKKAGITDATQSRYLNLGIKIIRLLAVDLKPPPAAIVAQAEQLQATGVVPVQPPPVVTPAPIPPKP